MDQFTDVLEKVRSFLVRARTAEVRTLLEGLVEQRIISEEYRKSLSLYRLVEALGPEPRYENPNNVHLDQGQIHQVRTWTSNSDVNHHDLEESEFLSSMDGQMIPLYDSQDIQWNNLEFIQEFTEGMTKDKHQLDHELFTTPKSVSECRLRLNDEMGEVLSSAESLQKPVSDNERKNKGNLGNEEEWLEQVEEAARRIAVPLWQHWDRAQGMLQPLVPCTTAGWPTSSNMVSDSEAQSFVLNMEEEMELEAACRSLDACASKFECMELGIPVTNFAEEASDEPEDLHLSTFDILTTTGLTVDHFRQASPAEINISGKMEGYLDIWFPDDRTTGDLFYGTASGLPESTFMDLSSGAPKDPKNAVEMNSFCSNLDYSMTESYRDNLDFSKNDGLPEIFEEMDLHGDAKMQSLDQDSLILFDFNLPEDLSEYLDEDYLDPAVFFDDHRLNSLDELNHHNVSMATDVPNPPDYHEEREDKKLPGKAKNRQKRKTGSQKKSPEKKRKKATDLPKTQDAPADQTVTHETDDGPVVVPPQTVPGLCTPPPKILHVYSSHSSATPIPIQFITIPDASAYQLVQLASPPPVIRLSNTAAPPTYILVPATSPPCQRQVPPLSPVDGAVAPVLMSSSPPGSLSDSASRAMSTFCTSPPSPNYEISPCKESPQSPTVVDIPQSVKDYIQETKAHILQACQHMEPGLSMTTHYVEVQVSQRETVRSAKNANKCLDKELAITGDIDRQKCSLRPNQIFQSNGDKSRRCILLLGNAGMGKTTLIKKLCLDWSRDCSHQFDFVFLLDGKGLTLKNPVHSLQTLLLDFSSFAPCCKDPEAVYAQILAAPKRVLIIFDGFNELRDYETLLQTQEKDLVTSLQKDSKAQTFTVRQLYSAILQRVLLPGCTLLLSTRPRGTASQLLRRADSLLEVQGFTPANAEAYLSQYFTDSALRASALDYLRSSCYLHLLCWNPGLCRLVCMVLEHYKSPDLLPTTLTGLCYKVLFLKMEKDRVNPQSHDENQAEISVQSGQETLPEFLKNSQERTFPASNQAKSRAHASSCNQQLRRTKEQEKQGDKVDEVCREADRTEDIEIVSQLSSLAWEGVKANTAVIPSERAISAKVKAFGLRTGLLLCQSLRMRSFNSSTEQDGSGNEDKNEVGGKEGECKENRGNTDIIEDNDEHILLWANPFLQSYLAAHHLSFSRTISDRSFLLTLPFQTGGKGRRRPQREELELTQRFVVGLLFHNRTESHRIHSHTEAAFRDMLANKQALVTKHLDGLSYGDLSPAQVLEACNYVYEASFTHQKSGRDPGLLNHLAANLPESLTFRGVPLSPPDVFTVQKALEQGGAEERNFCLDLEDSGIQINGLRALMSLSNINTYRACIADVIALWEQLQQSGEEGLLQGAVSKFKIHPLKATQMCHIEHLEKLVNIHVHKRLSDSSGHSDSILAEGVPAVKELHKLELELGPENAPLVLPKLWDLLPGLHNLQHLDLENSKIGDKGAEKLADALVSLCSLEILNLSQNCIGDQGVKKLALSLKDLPRLHCLSLYSNVISDEGAESLAAALPHMASLTDLDVKYNKLTDVGAQSFGDSLRNCKKIKSLRMWNQCIPYRVFERLQQQDSRILWH